MLIPNISALPSAASAQNGGCGSLFYSNTMATTREQMAAFRARHRERLKLQARQYRKDYAAEISIRRKAVYAARREDILAALRIKRAKNPEAQRNADRAYRERLRNDPIRAKIAREKDRLKAKRLRDTDTLYRLTNAFRSRLTRAVRVQHGQKAFKTMDLVGCSVALLRARLESKFTDGMSWENYGKWHIDHIIACAEFDLRNPEQQRKCFHYSNLQPLWGPANLKKNAPRRTKLR